ncbi:hypothetical protein ACJX0J_041399, partial [Zea mays]
KGKEQEEQKYGTEKEDGQVRTALCVFSSIKTLCDKKLHQSPEVFNHFTEQLKPLMRNKNYSVISYAFMQEGICEAPLSLTANVLRDNIQLLGRTRLTFAALWTVVFVEMVNSIFASILFWKYFLEGVRDCHVLRDTNGNRIG